MKTKQNTIPTEEFDRRFEAGEDISGHLDWSRAKRPSMKENTLHDVIKVKPSKNR